MRSLALILTVLTCTACMARGGLMGALKVNFDAPVATVHQAVLDVVRGEGLSLEEESVDQAVSLVKARYADNTPVTIHTQRFTDKASSCTIQVGAFGNQERSEALYTALNAQLAPKS